MHLTRGIEEERGVVNVCRRGVRAPRAARDELAPDRADDAADRLPVARLLRDEERHRALGPHDKRRAVHPHHGSGQLEVDGELPPGDLGAPLGTYTEVALDDGDADRSSSDRCPRPGRPRAQLPGAVPTNERSRDRGKSDPSQRRPPPGRPPARIPELSECRVRGRHDEAHAVDAGDLGHLHQRQHAGLRVAEQGPRVAQESRPGELGGHPSGAHNEWSTHGCDPGALAVPHREEEIRGCKEDRGDPQEEGDTDGARLQVIRGDAAWQPARHPHRRGERPHEGEPERRAPGPHVPQCHEQRHERDPGRNTESDRWKARGVQERRCQRQRCHPACADRRRAPAVARTGHSAFGARRCSGIFC
jgi:hypothetical protein